MTIAQYLGRRRPRPLTCLGDVGELEAGSRSRFDAAMPASHPMRLLPRKWWEWDYIADCAETLGLLTPQTTALGLGVGDEPLIFYFANTCRRVIATDLYSADTAWKEARFANAGRVLAASPIPYPRERVSVLNVDMRNTGVDAGSVDLVWSCSSIEHVPTLVDLFSVFAEIDRVLKVGGHAILTTEYCLSENPYLLPGVNAWNREFLDVLTRSLPGYSFLGPLDLSFNALHPGNAARPRRYMPLSFLPASAARLPYNRRAGTLANPVGLSVIVPIAFVIKKTSGAGVTRWDDAKIPARLRTYSEGVKAFFDGKHDEAVDKLETVCAAAGDDVQLHHLAFRFLIDARARRGEMEDRDGIADRIERFLANVPRGPVQDADCLDICGYLLGECGRGDAALSVYERCLFSPSTSKDHVLELCLRTLVLAEASGQMARGRETVVSVLADLVQFGMRREELEKAFFAPGTTQLGSRAIRAVRRALTARVTPAAAALKI